jgi:hypothetical protein
VSRQVLLERDGTLTEKLGLGCPDWHEIVMQLEMPREGPMWREGVTLTLRPEDEDEVHRKAGPVMLVEVKPQIIVDMNLIVPMADGGWWGRIDYPVRDAQHVMEPRRRDGLGDRVTADDDAVESDLYLDHRSSLLPPNPAWVPERAWNNLLAC